ncbi:bifunctional ADP-dependent NAD(P)H-hydrate dehydratase/NAD(P)H-hydrate epimerase [candidate division KSB3 bacterium]|uniref:Bifunctional NAD(P)H-hydrate repair enzyme n=1 Tax=candidate division KSB3 bacterium TaxID=2044937 RepID=A0A2G6E252_9BACT|nr:MAG: bifunctional ADP-dependent NAD(P)H-hydrate dehydratase/NAD(P)H-hydrate epimerase [candidate division KSB3 bacterium]PIE30353.1 MAG: bifunctional ADP-dependent NAD(P)H-hydrate dehydratase/NAD(P)H-hydrate epimerase [candidate division KSB3 bacterium]
MKVATAAEIRELDRRAIEDVGIPGAVLMENAGTKVLRVMQKRYAALKHRKVLIVCGKGNNGGDGLVLARHLFNRGVEVRVTLLADRHQLVGDAKLNFVIAAKMDIPIVEITSNEQLPAFRNLLPQADILVDAILGTGLNNAVKGLYKHIIESMNKSGKPIIAVDIPSGLSADSGAVPGSCIHADLTVTFAVPKRGLLLYPAANYVGQLEVVDIGIPVNLLDTSEIRVHVLEAATIKRSLIKRSPNTHKGTYGHVLVIAGSPGKAGAALMTGRSALRAGSGLVTLAIPKNLRVPLEIPTMEVMTAALPETHKGTVSIDAFDEIMRLAEDKRVLALGPGLSTHPSTVELVYALIRNIPLPMVIDADAINAIALNPDILLEAKAPLVLTPHPGEMARLVPNTQIQNNRIPVAQDTAHTYHVHLALKGARTLIASPSGNVFINPTGNPGMATAGSGDVLTGMIAGLISQNMIPIEATKTGVFLHGLAGDIVKEEKGDYGMIAGDILESIPYAIKRVHEL